jgi:cell wall-associated NlpC family hydrolase
MLALSFALLLQALPPTKQAQVVAEARKVLDVPYVLGGRLRNADDGLDCQGLVFFALQPITQCGWRSWSAMPTTSVQGELGLPVKGAAPVAADKIDLARLEPGDIIWFVDPVQNPAEPAIARLDDKDVWVWHTGLYMGDGKFIVGDHHAGKVVEEPLLAYTKQHYAGIFVSRMKDGPVAARCRRHSAMKRH